MAWKKIVWEKILLFFLISKMCLVLGFNLSSSAVIVRVLITTLPKNLREAVADKHGKYCLVFLLLCYHLVTFVLQFLRYWVFGTISEEILFVLCSGCKTFGRSFGDNTSLSVVWGECLSHNVSYLSFVNIFLGLGCVKKVVAVTDYKNTDIFWLFCLFRVRILVRILKDMKKRFGPSGFQGLTPWLIDLLVNFAMNLKLCYIKKCI